MQRPGPAPPDERRRFGLCGACVHGETLDSRTGSRFLFCARARTEPAYAKYPPVPVFACAGFAPRDGAPPAGAPPAGAV